MNLPNPADLRARMKCTHGKVDWSDCIDCVRAHSTAIESALVTAMRERDELYDERAKAIIERDDLQRKYTDVTEGEFDEALTKVVTLAIKSALRTEVVGQWSQIEVLKKKIADLQAQLKTKT